MHASLCDMITDLVQNAIEANAKAITLTIEETNDQLKVTIQDNGNGMSAETLEKAKDPFYSDGLKHAHRKVGLGLPFLFQTVELTDGEAMIDSYEGKGTTVEFTLNRNHFDLPEFGNFTTVASSLMNYAFDGDLTIERKNMVDKYCIQKQELTEILGDLNDLENMILLKEYIASQEAALEN